MSKDVLFTITKEHLETGLRGFPVGYCTTSHVDPQKGLFYLGRPVTELSTWQPEQVIYLLYHGKEGNKQELEKFSEMIKQRSCCSQQVIATIEALSRQGHPMKLFCIALLLLGMHESADNYAEDCLNMIAKVPHLAAAVINHHAGFGKTPNPRLDLGYMENFCYMLQVPDKREKELVSVMNLFNILHYDHGGGNLSTFVGKAVASGLEDMYGSICAAMCALEGPRHGRANQDCLEFVSGVLTELGEKATAKQVEKLIRKRLLEKKLVFGFGHAVLRLEDPRATLQYDFVQKYYPDHPLVKIALLLRTEGIKVLLENPKISDPYPNVDAISGTMLTVAGFAYPEYYTILFGLSRSIGIAMQIVYERTKARDGRGTPIVRPKYLYKSRV
ncbi:Citrate synthase [Candidatus Rhabdochlamydia oedothoracis]|uniref:citrate synthase (unknown stereospecificity) n=1 Tax=Candidatus Rhabdochlamydia oedothoracis TaxID=2720720 RepID=A0ABX8V1C7_9BACT|nr:MULTISPECIES: citrate (Si)-synthase [Rhabdochlamydia]KAG6558854.1 Citrate synthase 2 [Candidatus Rhabdochlamydia sp. W815]MCL6756531.1 citrate (Si)-synthase [Candidatus Rhabdochlamydia oedothoracis]QYF49023.1 Citrate synthase [Candidatus Rhabdochlamydia oedothoracis]